jgi:hypothetical protein
VSAAQPSPLLLLLLHRHHQYQPVAGWHPDLWALLLQQALKSKAVGAAQLLHTSHSEAALLLQQK